LERGKKVKFHGATWIRKDPRRRTQRFCWVLNDYGSAQVAWDAEEELVDLPERITEAE